MTTKEQILTIEKEAREVYTKPFLVPSAKDRSSLSKKYASNKDKILVITVTEKE